MKFKALSLLFGWEQFHKDTMEFVKDVSYRHDIPHGNKIPLDLRDREGTFQLNKNGYPVPGMLHVDDVKTGSTSPVLPLYIGLYSLIVVLGGLLPQLGLYSLPVFLNAAYFIGFIVFFGFLATIGFGFITVGSMALLPYIAAPLSTLGFHDSTIVMVFKAIPAFLPLIYLVLKSRRRASHLFGQGEKHKQAIVHAPKSGKNVARHIQAIDAINDKSKFLKYGTALGTLSFNGDSFAPDKGLPFGQSENDLAAHLAVFGETRSGKTTQLRTILKQIVDGTKNGVFLLDGKGLLARDCAAYLDKVIDHTTPMNLLEGLSPEKFAAVLQEQNTPEGGMSGNSKYFSDQARNICFTTGVFQHILVKHKLVAFNLTQFKNIAAQLFVKSENPLESLLKQIPSKDQTDQLFVDAMNHYKSLHAQDGEGFQAIQSSVEAWLAPFFQSEKLRHWCDCEKSAIHIPDTLYGAKYGLCLPEKEFLIAGKVATGIMKARFYSEVGTRSDNWRATGQSQVFLMIDEAHRVADSFDAAMVPLGGSMGLTCIFATQNINAYVKVFKEHGAYEMMASFISIIAFRTSHETYEYIRNRIGKDRVWMEQSSGLNLAYGLTAKLALANGMYDSTNPNSRWMRHLSFGLVKNLTQTIKHSDIGFGKSDINPKFASIVLSEHPIHILQDKDIQIVQTEPFTAIATIKRAGVPRRDIIKSEPLDIDFNKIAATIEEKILNSKVDFGEDI